MTNCETCAKALETAEAIAPKKRKILVRATGYRERLNRAFGESGTVWSDVTLRVDSVKIRPNVFTIFVNGSETELAIRPKGNGGTWEVRMFRQNPAGDLLWTPGEWLWAHDIQVGADE